MNNKYWISLYKYHLAQNGIKELINDGYNYIATDYDGETRAFTSKPTPSMGSLYWHGECSDWSESLVELSELLDEKFCPITGKNVTNAYRVIVDELAVYSPQIFMHYDYYNWWNDEDIELFFLALTIQVNEGHYDHLLNKVVVTKGVFSHFVGSTEKKYTYYHFGDNCTLHKIGIVNEQQINVILKNYSDDNCIIEYGEDFVLLTRNNIPKVKFKLIQE